MSHSRWVGGIGQQQRKFKWEAIHQQGRGGGKRLTSPNPCTHTHVCQTMIFIAVAEERLFWLAPFPLYAWKLADSGHEIALLEYFIHPMNQTLECKYIHVLGMWANALWHILTETNHCIIITKSGLELVQNMKEGIYIKQHWQFVDAILRVTHSWTRNYKMLFLCTFIPWTGTYNLTWMSIHRRRLLNGLWFHTHTCNSYVPFLSIVL